MAFVVSPSLLGDQEAMEKVGSRIRAQRLRRNLSQSQVAMYLGISLPTYRKVEFGDGTVEFRHVVKTLGVLDLLHHFAEAIPEVDPEITLKDLLAPERQRASKRRKAAS